MVEIARLTENRPELDEQEQRVSNERLAYIADHIDEQPEVFIRYFVSDERKSGGAILFASGTALKVLINKQQIVMSTGVHIPFDAIVGINLEK